MARSFTYDTAYAREIYPFLKEVAAFWEDYLKFKDGRYIDYDDNFWEVGPFSENWKKDYGDINPTITLGLLRMFFKGILEVSNYLDLDRDKKEKWNHILQHLSPIPTENVNGMIRNKACEGGTGSGSATLPGFGRVMMHGLEELRARIQKTALPNLWVTQDGEGIETLSAIPSCLNEMLLQGYEGVIRLFPAWPVNQNASFKQLREWRLLRLFFPEKRHGRICRADERKRKDLHPGKSLEEQQSARKKQ